MIGMLDFLVDQKKSQIKEIFPKLKMLLIQIIEWNISKKRKEHNQSYKEEPNKRKQSKRHSKLSYIKLRKFHNT